MLSCVPSRVGNFADGKTFRKDAHWSTGAFQLLPNAKLRDAKEDSKHSAGSVSRRTQAGNWRVVGSGSAGDGSAGAADDGRTDGQSQHSVSRQELGG